MVSASCAGGLAAEAVACRQLPPWAADASIIATASHSYSSSSTTVARRPQPPSAGATSATAARLPKASSPSDCVIATTASRQLAAAAEEASHQLANFAFATEFVYAIVSGPD